MTTFTVPPAGSPDWREIYSTPPIAPLYTVGPYCPLDDTLLQERPDGFGCPLCCAAWDFHGLCGRWLNEPAERRLTVLQVTAGAAGCAGIAAALVAVLHTHEHLVWLLAALIAAATAAIVLVALGGRARDWARYRHNQLTATEVNR